MDRRLVEQAMHGDDAAFGLLVGRLADSLYSVARRILRDTALAEDATQQTLMACWRFLPHLRDPDRFEAWVNRLLVNACHAEAKRERRQRANLRLLAPEEQLDPDPASRIANRDQLDHAFRSLSLEHRTVLVLVHYAGLSTVEAAAAMGIPAGTARSRLHYALEQMRAAIDAEARHVATTRGTA